MAAVFKAITLAIGMIFIAGCQPFVRTHITTYHDSSATPLKGDIVIRAPKNFAGSTLEFSFYKKKLAQHFKTMGLNPVDSEDAPFVAVLNYGVTRQEKESSNTKFLMGGSYGFSRRSGTTIVIANDDSGEFENVRQISLTILRNQKNELAQFQSAEAQSSETQSSEPQEVLNISAISTGSCGHLSVVVDEMLDAIFQQLYRPDGSIKKVKVKGSSRCP